MKAIVALLLVVAFAMAQSNRGHVVSKGSQLIDLLEGDMPGTYLIMFFDHNADRGRTTAMRTQAKEQILARHRDVHYYEVDVDDVDFQDLVRLIKVDKTETSHMPTFYVSNDGLGFRVHGQEAVKELSRALASKDWWLAHRHQRTAKEVEEEKKAKEAEKK